MGFAKETLKYVDIDSVRFSFGDKIRVGDFLYKIERLSLSGNFNMKGRLTIFLCLSRINQDSKPDFVVTP